MRISCYVSNGSDKIGWGVLESYLTIASINSLPVGQNSNFLNMINRFRKNWLLRCAKNKPRYSKTHVKSNNGKNQSITCDRKDCNRTFQGDFDLQKHLRIHDNNVTKCFYCQWGGVQGQKYSLHMNTHFRVRPFKCEKCPERFYELHPLQKHVDSFHERDFQKYSCGLCVYTTNTSDKLYSHKKTKHWFLSFFSQTIPDINNRFFTMCSQVNLWHPNFFFWSTDLPVNVVLTGSS